MKKSNAVPELIIFVIFLVGCSHPTRETTQADTPPKTPFATRHPALTTDFSTFSPSPIESPTPSAVIPRYEQAKCAFELPDGFYPQCGYLIVPEDRGQPNGREIRLHVAIFKSTNPNPEPDPVFHLIGGPGASALDNVRPILMRGGIDILKRRDYILFDQRGTQYSDPNLFCLPYDEYLWSAREQDLNQDEYNDGALSALAACLENWRDQGVNLATYNSKENAADVNDLRMALGYKQINLYGTSYGSRLALNVLRDHPDGIRSVIIDSIYPPQVNLDLDIAANVNRSLQGVFQACAANNDCLVKYGDVGEKFYQVIDQLENVPVRLETYGPYRQQPYTVYLDGDLFIDTVFGMLYSMVSIADIPHFIQLAYEKSYDELSALVGGAIGSPLSTGLFWSTVCSEELPFEINVTDMPDMTGVPMILRRHFTEQYTREVCKLWDIPPADPVENQAVVSDIPTLLFSGKFDPITPPHYAKLTAETLNHHYFFEFPMSSHGVMRSNSCALQMGLAFIDDPLHAPDSACIEEATIVEFQ